MTNQITTTSIVNQLVTDKITNQNDIAQAVFLAVQNGYQSDNIISSITMISKEVNKRLLELSRKAILKEKLPSNYFEVTSIASKHGVTEKQVQNLFNTKFRIIQHTENYSRENKTFYPIGQWIEENWNNSLSIEENLSLAMQANPTGNLDKHSGYYGLVYSNFKLAEKVLKTG